MIVRGIGSAGPHRLGFRGPGHPLPRHRNTRKPCFSDADQAFSPGTLERLAAWQGGGLRAQVLSDGWLTAGCGKERRMLGVVLAGGASQRFGRDKAEALFDGEPLWQRQARVLRDAGADRVVVVRRPGQAAPPGIECWRDQRREAGPLAGLHAALAPRAAPLVAVLAVDMPGIDAAWFRWLAGHCRPGPGGDGAACRGPASPLAAIYPREALDEIERRLACGEHSLQSLARALAGAQQLEILWLPAAETTAGGERQHPGRLRESHPYGVTGRGRAGTRTVIQESGSKARFAGAGRGGAPPPEPGDFLGSEGDARAEFLGRHVVQEGAAQLPRPPAPPGDPPG